MQRFAGHAVDLTGPNGTAPIVLICEHASNFIPEIYGDLGLGREARHSHIAWDIGAAALATRLGARLGAPLVSAAISRLVYDCNRPLDADDAIPAVSEIYQVPGNSGLSEAERRARYNSVHDRFHDAAARLIERQEKRVGGDAVVVTIHSFTPVYNGQVREVEIGYLCHSDCGLAKACFEADRSLGRCVTRMNEPYSARDGVTYSLNKHADSCGRQGVMIEVRNDMLTDQVRQTRMAAHLAEVLTSAIAKLHGSQEVRA